MYGRLIPVLPVGDVLAERGFLRFELHVDPEEQYPEAVFAALVYEPKSPSNRERAGLPTGQATLRIESAIDEK